MQYLKPVADVLIRLHPFKSPIASPSLLSFSRDYLIPVLDGQSMIYLKMRMVQSDGMTSSKARVEIFLLAFFFILCVSILIDLHALFLLLLYRLLYLIL